MRRTLAGGLAAVLTLALSLAAGAPSAAGSPEVGDRAGAAASAVPVPVGAPLAGAPAGVSGAVLTDSTLVLYGGTGGSEEATPVVERSLTRTSGSTTVGEPVDVGSISHPFDDPVNIAAHGQDLAYLRASDGRLVLRSGGVDSVPAWAPQVAVDSSTRLALSARWVAIGATPGGVISTILYERATGAAYPLHPPRGAQVHDVVLSDDRAVLTVRSTFRPELAGIYTVALGPSGPVGDAVRIAQPSPGELLDAVGVTEEHAVWRSSRYSLSFPDGLVTAAIRWVRTDALGRPAREAVLGSEPDVVVERAEVHGTQVVAAVRSRDGRVVEVRDVDLLGLQPVRATRLPPGSRVLGTTGSLLAYADRGQSWLSDRAGGTVVAGRPAPAPTVTSFSPGLVATGGGTSLTVTGTGFVGVTGVKVGGVTTDRFVVRSPTELGVVAPAGTRDRSASVGVTTVSGTASAPGTALYTDLVTVRSPRRLVDRALTPGEVTCPLVAGTAVVPAGATGVLVNVTAAAATGPGHVVLYPDTDGTGATPAPTASTVNYEPGQDVANAAFVQVPRNGRICALGRGPAAVRLVVDVTGFTLPDAGLTLQTPQRLVDTRPGAEQVGPVVGPLPPRTVRTVPVTGLAGVPGSAESVLLNVTVTGATRPGNLRVLGGGEGRAVPDTSVVNFAPGQDKANSTIVDVRPDGTIGLWSDSAVGVDVSPVHVVVDVVGHVHRDAGTGLVVLEAAVPRRLVDTRADSQSGPLEGRLTARVVHAVDVAAGAAPPARATGVVLNVTAIAPSAPGNLRVYPDSDGTGRTPPPDASSVNYIVGRDIPNQVVVPLPPHGVIDLYSDMAPGGTVDVAVDLVGWVMGG